MAQPTDPPVPSTPPNSSNNPVDHPQSVRRESTRLRTPSLRPGFISTQGDSRRALVPSSPAISTNRSQVQAQKKKKSVVNIVEDDEESDSDTNFPPNIRSKSPTNLLAGTKQVASRTGIEVIIDHAQDSDLENEKHTKTRKKKDPTKDKDGFDHARLFFYLPGSGPKQNPNDTAWACRWCPNEFKASGGSYYNLKSHRDGANIKGSLRSACPGRGEAIKEGAHLPPTAAEEKKTRAAGEGTLLAYATKKRFDNKTLNKLLVIWIIRQSLPWLRVEDFLLRVSFDYSLHNAELYSRVWAASHAHQLYLEQRGQVLHLIESSKSKISLVSDVWTTKGSHKAFVGMACCYITPDWKYVCQHLAMKYISWHHNGKYLAVPFANVLTTDSGSNNFTMAKGVSSIFRAVDSTHWDVQRTHHRCVCHVIALILGAGLKALKISKSVVRPERSDQPFPTLSTIVEVMDEDLEDEDVVVIADDISETEEIDPDDAQPGTQEPGWERYPDDTTDDEEESDATGFAFTLKKIDYICRRIASSPQKQAEWKVWAKKLNYVGPGIIAGYGIRWNIAYESRNRAYGARKVIKQLLENESDKYTGRSADGHHFKSYELSSKEWEDINDLNQVLKEFLEMTKRMEGDGPKLPMVLYEYVRVLENLRKRKEAAKSTVLEPMYDPMLRVTQKYIDLALKCDTVVIATFLHPSWRMMLFNSRFKTHVPQITKLIQKVFDTREAEIDSLQPESPPRKQDRLPSRSTSETDSGGEEFNFYPANPEAERINTEIQRYNDGLFPMDKKGCVLGWWKPAPQLLNERSRRRPKFAALVDRQWRYERLNVVSAVICGSEMGSGLMEYLPTASK
ncbi:hypothetical protein PGTUg99_016176 [Puccinia graminis f. sp. tritici]|uniref:HAT C-terminal dimerisation domain-containing protein n=1 Tax=Puccinia graminis f. sp. tritici TaxID=56615 RepID=A0A5B0SHT8_PUCGR|nr:hypothetical protein PGTUg99_016176 [Puccinia graminis f. sp. tritici]